ncbi:Amino-acid acetyltransferase [Anaerohalosphaera lusitana]|uniref:Amino-acid acetyltransferase n=1 Tax=Anaerohalosphaera lusitana TaxID=1936003 RepID=A0A1U9NLM8_9BACT|nr:N-acetyltransferase [Anaerohalosphaera lusitana]AQT68841.1 Amino-acid acetyltransferase [Anaerohalosphaera lusitana]
MAAYFWNLAGFDGCLLFFAVLIVFAICYSQLMQIRKARSSDARAINELIASHAELERMLFRSMADIYDHLQTFSVAEEDGRVVGCCALSVVWEGLCEVKSLAVDNSCMGKGLGRKLVEAQIEKASELGLEKIFTLTLEPGFFEKLGFERVDRMSLPMKVWSDCAKCSKQDHCDETALARAVN